MNLRELKIKNIASFEDATVRFDAEPLADTDLFLIAGPTGSGKSTILDAISLVLYDNTPRLADVSNSLGTMNQHDGVSLQSTSRMLRRGEREGSVTLTFGLQEKDYKAYWGVTRTRGGNYRVARELTCAATGLCLTRSTEITAFITEKMGLDFSQFCRTAMLSQGEFSRFLNSGEKEKSDILQKLTGAVRFEAIGRKVYELTAVRERSEREARVRLDALQALSPEEIEAINADTASRTAELEKITARQAELVGAQKWIADRARLEAAVSAARTRWAAAVAEANGEQAQAERRNLDVYDRSATARAAFLERRAAESEKNAASLAIDRLASAYSGLLASVGALRGDLVRAESGRGETGRRFEAHLPYERVYAGLPAIESHVAAAGDAAARAARNSAEAARLREKTAGELEPAVAAVTAELTEAEKRGRDIAARCAARVSELEAAGLAGLRRRKEETVALTVLLDRTAEATESALEAHEAHEAAIRENKTMSDEIAKSGPELAEAARQTELARVALDTASQMLHLHNLAADRTVSAIRAMLRPGDRCPVCDHAVDRELPAEETVRSQVGAAKAVVAEKQEAHDGCMRRQAAIEARMAALRKACSEGLVRQERLRADLEARTATAVALGKEAGVEYAVQTHAGAAILISKKKDSAMSELNTLNGRIATLEVIEKDVEALRRQSAEAEAAIRALMNRKVETVARRDEAGARVRTLEALAGSDRETAAARTAEVNSLIEDVAGLREAFKADPRAFIGALRGRKAEYERLVKENEAAGREVETLMALLADASSLAGQIAEVMPEWRDAVAAAEPAASRDSLVGSLRTLLTQSTMERDKAARAGARIAEAESVIAAYHAGHPDVSAELLSLLALTPGDTMLKTREAIRRLDDTVVAAESALKLSEKELAGHIAAVPPLIAADSEGLLIADTLSCSVAEAGAEADALKAAIAVNGSRLAENRRKIETRRQLAHEHRLAADEYVKWKSLNDLIGDATGKKFKVIALSYVLGQLIDNANVYMRRLSDRYTLSIQPGTYVILVEDAYQGHVTRPSHTISGGETFLVSLALALALSDIGSFAGIDTLFIDEGFGTLSGEPLQKALSMLRTLHRGTSKRVGIISHIAELRERIPVHIAVSQSGHSGASTLSVGNL